MAFLFGHGEPFVMAFFLIADPGSENRSGREGNQLKREEEMEHRKVQKLKLASRNCIEAILAKSQSQGSRG
jgi:hypothetical protein